MELVFIRHGQSEWNAKNLFTGWRDVKLSEQGIAEAQAAGRKLKEKGYLFDIAFTSVLTRAIKTCNSFWKSPTNSSCRKSKPGG